MLTLTIRTDKPEAEIGLYDTTEQLAYTTWQAHRELAETLHAKLNELLASQQKTLKDVQGIVVFKGPGSFTGLRIGITVANALAYSLSIPVVANEDPQWLQNGIARLENGDTDEIALPEYGALPHITAQKK
ncbi:MAG TPA: tRNA (adenosine(37)-N6)-threonylcarbamoyltransferase complex dimerization subunit type 1 TsaB [Candidatus Microsaccharimonas sp.]|nr:tRNA (adenosine(37)-N6)-threonylcarbamoyltransferase complex dimerization subunit type 1 TsaB [Candidatus Microsaccharimonas sp.]